MICVCHILSGDLWAGAEAMAWNLIRTLNGSKKVSVWAIVLNPGRLAEALEKEGVRVVVVDEARLSFAQLLFQMRRALKAGAPDIIHTHRYKENIIAFLVGGFSRTTRLVSTQHGMPESGLQRTRFSKKIVSRLNTFLLKYAFHRLVCVSEDLRKAFAQGVWREPERIRVIYNGITLPGKVGARRDRGVVTVGSAGRFCPVKDFALMIDVARNVRRKGGDVRFRLAGDGPLKGALQDRAEAWGLSACFVFAGHVEDMPAFYRSLDIYINTSTHEGIPMSILEAMAWGLPVVAPLVGGIGEIITHGIDGYLVRRREPEAFARRVVALCEDERLRGQVARQAASTVRNRFSAEMMAAGYIHVYRGLIKEAR